MIQPQGQSAAGRIMSMKNSNDTMWNRTRDLPACGVVPQPTAPPRAVNKVMTLKIPNKIKNIWTKRATTNF